MNLYVKAFESYRLTDMHTFRHTYHTDRQTDRQRDRIDRNYKPRRFAVGQKQQNNRPKHYNYLV